MCTFVFFPASICVTLMCTVMCALVMRTPYVRHVIVAGLFSVSSSTRLRLSQAVWWTYMKLTQMCSFYAEVVMRPCLHLMYPNEWYGLRLQKHSERPNAQWITSAHWESFSAFVRKSFALVVIYIDGHLPPRDITAKRTCNQSVNQTESIVVQFISETPAA